ncbi:Glucose-methanol-choline oxidoreductase [Penicillium digitatum]|nr:Glucose-methanol-choline oxidoreductase [Penicillium digitatum]
MATRESCALAAGHKLNLDHNSGNPLGMAATINSAHKGKRTTAVDLLLNFASRDVILSTGSLDTPKILMHSGIGPAADLEKFKIPVVQDLPAVGQGLRDHYFVPLDPAAMEAAMRQWEENNTGPWTRYSCQVGSGWFKSDRITSTPEFKALPASVQEFMNRETIPHYEMITHVPIHFMMPDMFKEYSYLGLGAFMMNEQSRGEVRLQSSDPDVPLLFNPRFLEDPFDRRACIEIYRHLLEVSRQESFATDTISTLIGPASDFGEDILRFWKNFLSSSWHMTGTAKMGKADASDAAVDTYFRVRGIENLRVADMSVIPILINNHTQATAYVTGVTCAEVLIKEYGLDAQ